MKEVIKLSDKKVKIMTINILKALIKKIDNMQEHMDNIS